MGAVSRDTRLTRDLSAEVAALAAVPLFALVDPARLDSLVRRSTARVVRAGTVVAVRGQPADHLVVVVAGALTALHDTAEGRRLRLGEFPAPCTVDKAAVLDGSGHSATWISTCRTRLRLLPAEALRDLIDDVPAVRHHVLGYLSRQLRHQQEQLVRASFTDTTARVAAWLVRAAGRPGTSRDTASRDTASRAGARVVLPGAQAGLAEAVGASRVSVNRALRALARDGLVRVEPGAVHVLALDRLTARARTPDGLG
ncbi:Crp/Fnr family transcriptional regulator [Goodfellowiella coeruleoviolacea]|uniref:CRP/FNR family transcriptional regulator, anaerobic regulatory protein n=1 Tax=Goodfellowiella coeruleoviolacea TaxID=334858 RepID=A0AAE3GKC3_9PSEU|nr:Crp/Fnr family transcriptional regulator [Goodfellowiella coeruleoviolacea]MCP2169032.1 CRP/FNR family transcriptional regulator, anaerobic regulatory protein [Goodfellowiella coeruleoviolacea]